MEVNIQVAQMNALIEMLEAMHFNVSREQKMFLPNGATQSSVLLVNRKMLVGVEIFEEECKVMPCKVQETPGGAYNPVPLAVPNRLFFNRPEILKAFLMEVVEPAKANAAIKALPEA